MPGNWPTLVPDPPSSVTGSLGDWLREVTAILNSKVARVSYFSGPTPPSSATALPGYLAINMSPSQSTDSRVFVKGGTGTTPSPTGWVLLRTG